MAKAQTAIIQRVEDSQLMNMCDPTVIWEELARIHLSCGLVTCLVFWGYGNLDWGHWCDCQHRQYNFGSHNGPGHFIWLICYFSQLNPKYTPKQSNWDHHGWETVFECSLAYHLWIKLMCNVWGNTSRMQRELWHTPVDIHICTLNYPAKIVGAPKSSTRWYQRPHPQAWLAIWKHLSNLWVAEFFCGGIHSPSM